MISKEVVVVIILIVAAFCTIAGFVLGSCHEEAKRIRKHVKKETREYQMRLIASQVCREWKEKEWQAEREKKEAGEA
jgi:predicted Holliday junction resolvase-like endonuclease